MHSIHSLRFGNFAPAVVPAEMLLVLDNARLDYFAQSASSRRAHVLTRVTSDINNEIAPMKEFRCLSKGGRRYGSATRTVRGPIAPAVYLICGRTKAIRYYLLHTEYWDILSIEVRGLSSLTLRLILGQIACVGVLP
ncbi:unnamed protein product [Leptosia nina]|uniref:Uncharacterized protein n=1 Tax=Leptosia nina TaxID=320188 RepID=A0AAV1JY70_9NEOP